MSQHLIRYKDGTIKRITATEAVTHEDLVNAVNDAHQSVEVAEAVLAEYDAHVAENKADTEAKDVLEPAPVQTEQTNPSVVPAPAQAVPPSEVPVQTPPAPTTPDPQLPTPAVTPTVLQ